MERLATVEHGMTRSSFQVSVPRGFNGALFVQIEKLSKNMSVWIYNLDEIYYFEISDQIISY